MFGYCQSIGLVRKHNEDKLLTITANLSHIDDAPDFGLFVVADGMGGHKQGEIASAIAVESIGRTVIDYILGDNTAPEALDTSKLSPEQLVCTALLASHTEVCDRAPEGGTTVTAALVIDDQVSIAHIGDSRAYLVEDTSIKQLTHDHSLVQRMLDQGKLTPDEASIHPRRNVLYQAVGQGGSLDVDLHTHTVPAGGKLLLCSDGLWGMISDSTLSKIIHDTQHVQNTCERLVKEANRAGGSDNITAILVQLGSSPDDD